MYIIYIPAWFCVFCFLFFSFLCYYLEEPKKIGYQQAQITTCMIPPITMPNLTRICGLPGQVFDGFFFFFFLNATWPWVTRRAYTGSWLAKALSLLSLLPQQLLWTDPLVDRKEKTQVKGRDWYHDHSKAIFSLYMWSRYLLSSNCKMAEDNRNGFSTTPMIWKKRNFRDFKRKSITRQRSKKKDDNICIQKVV